MAKEKSQQSFHRNALYFSQVYAFFKGRIEMQYPLAEGKLDPYQAVKEQHESFMKSRSTVVLGRDDILSQARADVNTRYFSCTEQTRMTN